MSNADPSINREVTSEDVERYRSAVRTAVADSTVRDVARAVGMSHGGLHNFLNGSEPHGRTIGLIRAWYIRTAGVERVSATELLTVISRLVATLPDQRRGVLNVLSAIESSYNQQGIVPPEWIARVLNRLGTAGD